MAIKLSHPMLVSVVLDSYKSGLRDGDGTGYQRAQDSISALVSENSQLKRELDTIESRAQRTSFPAVYKEQQRIVAAIRKFFSVDDQHGPAWPAYAIEELLLALALGDIK